MTIKHLVISGGGPTMIQSLSIIQELNHQHYLSLDDIESIYGTSAGAIAGVMIALKYDWETINDYIIKRPWHDVFPINVENVMDLYSKKGLFDLSVIEKAFKPLFDAKDIPIHISLSEFYELTKIELHMFSFEINEYILQDISYKTYPELPLLTALQMTCAIPMLISPVCFDNKCFIDGGVACNYPLSFCVNSGKKLDEILGLDNQFIEEKKHIHNDSNLYDFISTFLFNSVFHVKTNYIQPKIDNEIICNGCLLTFDFFKSAIGNMETRISLFDSGKEMAKTFMNTRALQNSI